MEEATKTDKEKKGLIFDIQRFTVNDGPGIRTLVFIKGCPLRCEWCSNPESQKASPELILYEEKCIGCGKCLKACSLGELLKKNWPVDRDQCLGCGRCVDVCYAEARIFVGRWMSVREVLDIVLRDEVFYRNSGGGVTIGGGEPTYQAIFVGKLLKECKEKGIHTAVETCGYASWEGLKRLLRFTDLLLFDIKHMDTDTHREKTGVGNEKILINARQAARMVKEMIIRFPLIPGYNNSRQNINAVGEFIKSKLPQVRRVDILPYHSMGESKSIRLGRRYSLGGLDILPKEEIDKAKEILLSYGLEVVVGG